MAGMQRTSVLLGLAVVLVAVNLRPAVASVGPVLPELRADLGLSPTATAVLTMLPVLCFGVVAAAAPRLARLAGIELVLLGAVLVLLAGLVGRVLAGPGPLFAGTVLVGAAIAVANVLVPPLVKRDFPRHTGTMMGVYTMAVAGAAAIAAGATVPVGDALGQGWRGALGVWAVPAALACAVCLLVWSPRPGRPAASSVPPVVGPSVLRSPLAWHVTLFFGLQSMLFYAVLSWLPSIYRDHGYGPAAAGYLLSVFGLVQIPVTLVVPAIAARARNQVVPATLASGLLGVGLVGVLVAPTTVPVLWALLMGIGSGACFALALALFVLRARQVDDTARLSAMAQTVGYVISAAGPLLFGVAYDVTGSWTVPLLMLVLVIGPQLWFGALAGRARTIGEAPVTAVSREA